MSKKNGLSSAELSNFCGQVALILEAGLPLYDGMETLAGADSASANATSTCPPARASPKPAPSTTP